MNKYKNPYLKHMNLELASYIKDLRYFKRSCTWRAVAREVAEAYPKLGVSSGNQIDGMDLCEAAMIYLKEKIEDGWNS